MINPSRARAAGKPGESIRMYGTMSSQTPGSDTAVRTRKQTRLEPPKQYKVLLHNDHYTTMEFVVSILELVFHKSAMESVVIMLNVHEEGIGMAGVYTKEIAETKISTVHNMAREAGYPLRCSIEPE